MPSLCRITLVHAAALGDTLLLIPLLRALRLLVPNVHITLVTHSAFGQLLLHLRHVDAAFSADDPAHSRYFAPSPEPLPPLPWLESDLILSAVSTGHDAWADNIRQTLTRQSPRTTTTFFFSPRPPADYPDHVTTYHRDQLADQGLPIPERPLPPTQFDPAGPLVIHPGAGSLAKCWPLANFLTLADILIRQRVPIHFILGPAELERFPAPLLAHAQSFPHTIAPDLPALATFLTTARAYLGNDAGPTHLAAALGLPTLALFGTHPQSNPAQWSPVGLGVTVLQRSLATLTPAEVIDHLRLVHALP